MGVASCALTCFAAVLYLAIEWNADGPMKDAPLVALITFNVFAVNMFGLYITRDLTEMLDGFPSFKGADSQTIQAEIDLLMADPRGLVVAILYGLFLGISAYLISPWPDGSPLQFWFGAFVFCGNLLIGYAIWAILRFWYRILSEVPKIEFKALNLSHAPLPALLRFNSRIVMITAFVASMALLGLALADFDQSPPIILFSLFAFFMVLATYAVPVIPILVVDGFQSRYQRPARPWETHRGTRFDRECSNLATGRASFGFRCGNCHDLVFPASHHRVSVKDAELISHSAAYWSWPVKDR